MYQVLGQSKISINIHIDAAGDHANNMRLYESTGMGSLLITDSKKNLKDLFSVGSEVIAYNTVDQLCAAVEYYLVHEKEREAIALAGQKRTLREHCYGDRMNELAGFFKNYMEKR
jgi:spore maturation protein CgeB